MLSIAFYTCTTLILLFFLGYGVSVLLLPRGLRDYRTWISPWIGILIIIFSGVLLGFIGLKGNQWVPAIFLVLTGISAYEFYRNRSTLRMPSDRDVIIIVIISLIMIFNLSPLFLDHGFPTTLSLGSNDAQAFAIVPDFLVDHSIKDGFGSNVPAAVYTLLPYGYRIGQSIIAVFFMVLFHLRAYQFLTIIQAVLFVLTLPLIYVLFKLVYKETYHPGAVAAIILVGLNVNILYYLYHNFFGQILFTGLYLFLIILFVNTEKKLLQKSLSFSIDLKHDFLIGVGFAVLFYSYHEGVVFVLMPLMITIIFRVITKHAPLVFILSYTKSFLIAVVFALPAMIHAIKFAILNRVQDFIAPIGWQPFRAVGSSFANMFEMTGMYSIHTYPQLSVVIGVILSIIVAGSTYLGFQKSRYKELLGGFLVTYVLFFIFLSFVRPNFWFYGRAVSYSLPLLLIFFVGGIQRLVDNKKYLNRYVLTLIVWLVFINGFMFNKRYKQEHLVVEKWMTSLTSVPEELTKSKSIYSEQVFNPSLPIWKELWAEYFLEPRTNFVTSIEYIHSRKKIQDQDIVLISKVNRYASPAQLVTSQVLWENEYYRLSRVCVSDECLLHTKKDLHVIDFRKPVFTDSLLLKGWSQPEENHRWAMGKTFSLRLVNKKPASRLVFSATTLRTPQHMKVFIDGVFVGAVDLGVKWKTYTLAVDMFSGLHTVRFESSRFYFPAEVLGGLDRRELSADFQYIELR